MEQDSERSEHLSLERISALLDEPEADPAAAAHLERCGRCEREHERMRRMRMALSALGDVEPPAGEWAAIESRLPDEGENARSAPDGDDDLIPLFRSGWVAQVAAATLVFAVGLSAGLQLRDGAPLRPDGRGEARRQRDRRRLRRRRGGPAGLLRPRRARRAAARGRLRERRPQPGSHGGRPIRRRG